VTERFHLVGADILHDQITIDDPVVLEKPMTYTVAYKRMPNYEMVEFVCDNNREYVDDKGVVRMKVREH
jgi:HD superfamily phosphohydrolase YqeK